MLQTVKLSTVKLSKSAGENKGVPPITCSKGWNALFQGLEQLVPGIGIPPKQILERGIEGITIKTVPEMRGKSGTKCIGFCYNSSGVYASPQTLATAS
jgi:hypothetical protein